MHTVTSHLKLLSAKTQYQSIKSLAYCALLSLLCQVDTAIAGGMPKAPKVDGAVEDGDFLGYFRLYWKQTIAVLVLVICSYALVKIATSVLKIYHDYTAGKAEISDMFVHLGIGFMILIVMVLLLTQATDIFA